MLLLVGLMTLFWLGVLVIRGRRRLGLYLRKFGYGESTAAVTTALTTAVGRWVRVVTLDDAVVASVGVDRVRRWLAALTFLASVGLLVRSTTWYFSWINDGAGAGGEVVRIIMASVMLLVWTLLTPTALIAGGAWLAATRASLFAKRTVNSEQDIAETAKQIARMSRKIFSPRLFVARVANEIWQPAVSAFGAIAAVVIIDVSHPTEPLLWELQAMQQVPKDRWLLVGAHEHVAALADPRTAAGDDLRSQLARAVSGMEIIAYGHTPLERKQFSQTLRHRLDRLRSTKSRAANIS